MLTVIEHKVSNKPSPQSLRLGGKNVGIYKTKLNFCGSQIFLSATDESAARMNALRLSVILQTDAVMAMDPEALESIRAAAYAEGMADGMSAGQAAARQAFADEQAQNSALLNQVIASLQNFAADPEQLFEHLARQDDRRAKVRI